MYFWALDELLVLTAERSLEHLSLQLQLQPFSHCAETGAWQGCPQAAQRKSFHTADKTCGHCATSFFFYFEEKGNTKKKKGFLVNEK